MYLFIPSWSIAIFFLSQMPWSTYVYHLQGDDHFYSPLLGIGKTHDSFWSGWLLVLFHRRGHMTFGDIRSKYNLVQIKVIVPFHPLGDRPHVKIIYVCQVHLLKNQSMIQSIFIADPFFHNLTSSFFLLNQ